MSFWSSFMSFFGGVGNSDRGPQYSGPQSHSTESGAVVTDERALQVSSVWACVGLIAETTATLPLGVFRRTAQGREPVTDHYLFELLRVSPNALMTPQEFRETLTLQIALWGNGYASIERRGGKPVSLMPLQPEFMTPVRDETGLRYEYQTNGGIEVYAKESILHLKGKSADGVVGMSPLAYARHSLGVTVSADKYASKAFSSNGRPPGFITVDRTLTTEQREKVREMYQESSIDDVKTWVFEGGFNYVPVGIPPDDMQMLDSRRFQVSDIARFWRVPPHLINDTEKSTSWGTGIEQQNLAFLQYTLQPYLTRWESVIADALLSRTERRTIFVKHNVEGLLRADSAGRASFYSQMAQNGVYTRNEIRRLENLKPMEGADDLTVQVNLTPVDELEKVNDPQT